MKDIIIYNKFSSVVAAMQSCTDGGCDRFNTFHVGLLSDIQANNVNTEVPASYEFNRKVTETRTDGYSLPILILEPNGETFAQSGGSFQDFQSKKQITLFAGDIYNVGCCGVGNTCTERSKMQIIQDLKTMLLALIEEVTIQLELVGVSISIDSIVFSEDIGFNFGNIKLGGVKAELELYYSSCVEVCGFEYEEPDPVVCDDGGADLTIECSGCDSYPVYTINAGEVIEGNTFDGITLNGVLYAPPVPIDMDAVGYIATINAFLDTINGFSITFADIAHSYICVIADESCCADELSEAISINISGIETSPQNSFFRTCAEIQANPAFTDFECCNGVLLTAVEIGAPIDVDTDVTDYSFDQITWFANAPVFVAVRQTVVFRRRITYLEECPPTVIAKTVTVLSSCEDLLIE